MIGFFTWLYTTFIPSDHCLQRWASDKANHSCENALQCKLMKVCHLCRRIYDKQLNFLGLGDIKLL